MSSFSSYSPLSDYYYQSLASHQPDSFFPTRLNPPQEKNSLWFNNPDFFIPAGTDDYSLSININPSTDHGHLTMQSPWSQRTAEYGGVADDALLSVPRPLATQSQNRACGSVNVPASQGLVRLEPDFNLEHPLSFSPSLPQEDLIDDTGILQSWPELSTHDVLQFESKVISTQWADLSEGSWPNVYRILEGSMDSDVTNPGFPDQYSPAKFDFRPSFNDNGVLEAPTYPPESPTDEYIQPHPPHKAPSKYPQKGHRSVSSAAIVRASRMRRGVNRESGETRPSRFFCHMKECVELGVGFTAKHRYLDHLRRHAGVKPFKCTDCLSAYTNGSDLRRHQKNKKCATVADRRSEMDFDFKC
ncbi:hypothetical protein GYMLUDRAFT_77618 [Collybiopsis luxurians FD-317 M1]|uniref:C2H2-type domain-containing protein n=1 Tax=Collybiopsis luxurians FD-317 M1 TaxID=944289 RepID=A0A0D0CDN5_9AGAR|nr:hypothetical protein GYMLUDRAFT_77618 [Collybiopsis luxurians FD-317 M1]